MSLAQFAIFLSSLPIATCKLHHLFVGNLDLPKALYALSFDTDSLNLTLTNNITAHARHHWLTLSSDKRNLYATGVQSPDISSYSVVENGNNLHLDAVIAAPSDCGAVDSSANLVALGREPYSVYSASWPGKPACASVFTTFPNGTLSSVEHGYTYGNSSSIHGLALHPNGFFLYAADLGGDALWTNALSPNGSITGIRRKDTTNDGKHPRHVAVHPNGKWLYAVFEASNSISAYPIADTLDWSLKDTSMRYSLIPGLSDSDYASSTSSPLPPLDDRYWSAEITVSPSGRILWGTARAQVNTRIVGYISAFLLSPEGDIIERLFIVPTKTIGGIANSVSMAPDTDEFVAMADFKTNRLNGYVQMWKVEGLGGIQVSKINGNWERTDKTVVGMNEVARVNVEDGGCCANVVWVD